MAGLLREAVDRAMADAQRRLGRHRRRRRRQGARLLRGRHDARAVPGRRARRGGQAAAARAHRRLGRRLDRHRRRQPGAGRRAQARARGRVGEAVRVQRACGRSRSPCPFNMPVNAGAGGYFAPHVRSYIRRTGAPHRDRRDGGGQGPAERRRRTRSPTCTSPTSRSSRCRRRRCCGTRSATTRPARPPTAPAPS